MNEGKYDTQKLREYLLGSLADAETERFDELSFTDDNFAAELGAAEKDLIDGYVQNELKGATHERFESYYLASPVRRKRVEFAANFQVFAEKESAKTVVAAEPKRGFFAGLSDFFNAPRRSRQFGFASATLLLIFFVGGWFLLNNSRSNELAVETPNYETNAPRKRETAQAAANAEIGNTNLEAAQTDEAEKQKERLRLHTENAELERLRETQKRQNALEEQKRRQTEQEKRVAEQRKTDLQNRAQIAAFFLPPPLRGSSNLKIFPLSAQARTAAVSLGLESNDYAVYQVVLRNAANQPLWQSSKIKAKRTGENASLNVGFPANLLKPGVYTLEVSGVSADGTDETVGIYPFRVSR